jgi:hypothetical protein
VVNQDDLGGSQQALADRQRPDCVVGDHAAGVADDMGLALFDTEQAVHVESGVHARQHCDVLARRQRQWTLERLRVFGVVG